MAAVGLSEADFGSHRVTRPTTTPGEHDSGSARQLSKLMKPSRVLCIATLLAACAFTHHTQAWDYEGHRTVNLLALSSLPTNFPAFVFKPEARERIAFLSGEPDRWRNTPDLPLRHVNNLDHYFDMEDLAWLDLKPADVPHFRYLFTAHVYAKRKAHPERFPAFEQARNPDNTRELPGFLPWVLTEHYAKLKSAFSYLKTYEANVGSSEKPATAGTADEIANARQNIIAIMGTMGHFAGDASQPLHTTRNYNGWVLGENPKGYTTRTSFHAWIDGGYLGKVGIDQAMLNAAMRPARPVWLDPAPKKRDDVFPEAMKFIEDQFKLVEPLYQMEKDGKLSGTGEIGLQGKPFLHKQLAAGAQLLGDLWLTAWQEAPEDTFLKSWLARRKIAHEKSAAPQK